MTVYLFSATDHDGWTERRQVPPSKLEAALDRVRDMVMTDRVSVVTIQPM